MRTVRGISAAYKQPWMQEPQTFTAEVSYVPANDAIQFPLPTGSSVSLSFEQLQDFINAIEHRRAESNGQ